MNPIREALEQSGLSAFKLDRIRLARGVVGKATYVAVAAILALGGIAWRLAEVFAASFGRRADRPDLRAIFYRRIVVRQPTSWRRVVGRRRVDPMAANGHCGKIGQGDRQRAGLAWSRSAERQDEMTYRLFHVGIRPDGPIDPFRIERAFNSAGDWLRLNEFNWYLWTTERAVNLNRVFQPLVGPNGSVVILQIDTSASFRPVGFCTASRLGLD